MSLPRIPRRILLLLLFAPQPRGARIFYVLRKLPRASPSRLVSLGRPLSKHLINGFIVHFRGFLDAADTYRRNFTETYATVNNFFPPRTK